MKLKLIDDGMTFTGTAAIGGGGGPEMAFTYRPATAAEVDAFAVELGKLKADQKPAARAKWLAARIIAWDVEDAAGAVAPITAANVAKLPAGYLDPVENQIAGYARTVQAVEDEKKS